LFSYTWYWKYVQQQSAWWSSTIPNWQVFSISLSHTITYIYLSTAFTPNSEQVWQAWVYPPRLSICSLVAAQHSLSCVYESERDAHDRMTMKLRSPLLTSSSNYQCLSCWNSSGVLKLYPDSRHDLSSLFFIFACGQGGLIKTIPREYNNSRKC